MIINKTKQGALYCVEGYHFPFEQMWNDFVSTVDIEDERFKLLVEEVEFMRKQIANYYEKEIDAVL